MSFSDLKLFALSSNRELAERVAQRLYVNFQMEKFKLISKNQSVENTSLSYNQLAHL